MFKIGEFSKLVRVSPRMLRHYEKCGLLYPAKIDSITGYRQYSAAQIPLLTNIVTLRDMGFSIDEIGDILPFFDNATNMEKFLCDKEESVRKAIANEQDKLNKINAMREVLRKEQLAMNYEIILKELSSIKVLSLREVISDYSTEEGLWDKLGEYMKLNSIGTNYDVLYSIYWDDDHKEQDVDIEIAVPVDIIGKNEGSFIFKELDAITLAATVQFSGVYDNYGIAMGNLAEWLETNGYEIAGCVRGMAIRHFGNETNMENFLTELQVPVKKII